MAGGCLFGGDVVTAREGWDAEANSRSLPHGPIASPASPSTGGLALLNPDEAQLDHGLCSGGGPTCCHNASPGPAGGGAVGTFRACRISSFAQAAGPHKGESLDKCSGEPPNAIATMSSSANAGNAGDSGGAADGGGARLGDCEDTSGAGARPPWAATPFSSPSHGGGDEAAPCNTLATAPLPSPSHGGGGEADPCNTSSRVCGAAPSDGGRVTAACCTLSSGMGVPSPSLCRQSLLVGLVRSATGRLKRRVH
mmetsp:Transcript_21640/g.46308  ORF Transcript_21640/g.46308 Transcript_21640/m.46308 type:complete len:253 (+) Transcript_21640:854-1612(+)